MSTVLSSASQTPNAQFHGSRAQLLSGIRSPQAQLSGHASKPNTEIYKSPHTAHTLPPKTARNLGFAVQKAEAATNRHSPPLPYFGGNYGFEGYTPEQSLHALAILEHRKQELIATNLLLAQQQIILQNMQLNQACGGNMYNPGQHQRYQPADRTMPPTPQSTQKSPYCNSPQTPKFQMSVTQPGQDLPPTPQSILQYQSRQGREMVTGEVQAIRQPKGAPSVEELRSKDGQALNFAAMTRRKAVSKIVGAGIRRRNSPTPLDGRISPALSSGSSSSRPGSRLEGELDIAFPPLPNYV